MTVDTETQLPGAGDTAAPIAPADDTAAREAAAAQLEQLARARSTSAAPATVPASSPTTTPRAPRAPQAPRNASGRMKPDSVRWQRENRRRVRAGLPQLVAGDPSPAPLGVDRPTAAAAPRKGKNTRRDNSAALRAVQAQSGPVSGPASPAPDAQRAARLASAQDPQLVGAMSAGITQAVSMGFGMLAKMRGEHWNVADDEARALGAAWAPVAAYYGGTVDPLTMLWGGAIVTTVSLLGPRMMRDAELKRDATPAAPAPREAPRADAVTVPNAPATDPRFVPAGYTMHGAT